MRDGMRPVHRASLRGIAGSRKVTAHYSRETGTHGKGGSDRIGWRNQLCMVKQLYCMHMGSLCAFAATQYEHGPQAPGLRKLNARQRAHRRHGTRDDVLPTESAGITTAQSVESGMGRQFGSQGPPGAAANEARSSTGA